MTKRRTAADGWQSARYGAYPTITNAVSLSPGLGATPELIDDVLQELRHRLVEMRDHGAVRKGYAGRGSLGGFSVSPPCAR
jgi:hypothetical protein